MNKTAIKLLETPASTGMTVSHAKYLLEASDEVLIELYDPNHKVAKPSVEFLLTCESAGGRTVRDRITGDVYKFNIVESKARRAIANLTEDPDSIADQYMRFNYVFELFIGDESGCLVGSFGTHSVMLYTLRKAGAIQQSEEDEDTWELVHENLPKNIKVLGHPQYVKIDYSGVVLPKQDGKKPVDATYVSCWTSKGKAIVPLLAAYAKEQYHPPFKLEIGTSPDLSSGVFAISNL